VTFLRQQQTQPRRLLALAAIRTPATLEAPVSPTSTTDLFVIARLGILGPGAL